MSHHCLGTDLGEEVFSKEKIPAALNSPYLIPLVKEYQGRELTNLSSCCVEILLKKYYGGFLGAVYLSEACMDHTGMEAHNAAAGIL